MTDSLLFLRLEKLQDKYFETANIIHQFIKTVTI